MTLQAPELSVQIADADRGSRTHDDLVTAARTDFAAFVIQMFPELHGSKQIVLADYIDLVAEVLMLTTKHGRRRVIFNLPPGYMKSLLVSVYHTAWRLGVNPNEKIICISYGDDLSHDLSVKTRKVMQSALYRAIFPGTALEKKAEDKVTTTAGGQRYATAVGSDIAGFRADLIVIDDPMQPDAAASELAKQKLRDWYYGAVAQRLRDQATGVIILVMHRLAPDDLTQTFVDEGDWKHISLPLIADCKVVYGDPAPAEPVLRRLPGDLLSPKWQGQQAVDRLRKSLPSHVFAAQYQQNPLYGGSGMCSIDRLVRYGQAPPFEFTLHSWDVAGTKDGGNWTVCLKFGVAADEQGRDIFYLLHVIRIRVELPDVRTAIREQDRLDRPALVVMDGNGMGLGILQDLQPALPNLLPARRSMQGSELGDKKQQFFNCAVMHMYDGLIRIPERMDGLETLLPELAAFPNGRNDDLVDALSNVAANRNVVLREAQTRGERLGRIHALPPPPPTRRPERRRPLVPWRSDDND